MHSLLPDEIKIWDIETKKQTSRAYDLPAFSFSNAQNMFSENHVDDVLYTFGVEKAGDLVLRNYPAHLTDLQLPRHQGGGVSTYLIALDWAEPSVRDVASTGTEVSVIRKL